MWRRWPPRASWLPTIERVSRSTDDLRATLRVALSGDDVPDVVQANNSRSEMGQYVGAGLLTPLDGFADEYGWNERFPGSVRAQASYTDDGVGLGGSPALSSKAAKLKSVDVGDSDVCFRLTPKVAGGANVFVVSGSDVVRASTTSVERGQTAFRCR